MRYLVSLASEQAIPNILLIRTVKDIDRHVFITTPRMAELVERTCSICGITDPVKIEVDEYDLEGNAASVASCLDRLRPSGLVVNLTGGTKLMALGVFRAIQSYPAQAFYLPLGSNHAHLVYPSFVKDFLPVTHRLDAITFLSAYGIKAEVPNRPLHSYGRSEAIFSLFARQEVEDLSRKLNQLGNRRLDLTAANIELKAILAACLDLAPARLESSEWLDFVKGGWFEEYLCHYLQIVLPEGQVCRNVVTDKNNVKNELDLCFTHANALHVWELKSSVKAPEIKDILYKLDSLKNDYGLRPHCVLALASPAADRLWRQNAFLRERAAGMGIRVLTCPDLAPDLIQESIRRTLD